MTPGSPWRSACLKVCLSSCCLKLSTFRKSVMRLAVESGVSSRRSIWCSVESCAMMALTISSSSKGDFSSKATSVSRMLKGGSLSRSTMNCCADMSGNAAPPTPTVVLCVAYDRCLWGVHAAYRGTRGG